MNDDIKIGLAAAALVLLIIASIFTARLTAEANVPQVTSTSLQTAGSNTPTISEQAPDCLKCHQVHEIPLQR